ncbi:cora-like Mg2+ transporter protein-domain-containing protein [Dunaliella salina]|uniref:Cora-like Mg2+ transporter protein-domain-containing protein n=1 Tax=Dunaliella salina TaxID=3046 RepID=A0ABQ7GX28_DUNSA|nr:cora-like Mg2+ transporter protein-domain-containing protein [Dunaliella salina]|eukprot:KAF5839166.1 cora-like Mg2+ transporter protein-domain-containing protein [Dunaliella salina]
MTRSGFRNFCLSWFQFLMLAEIVSPAADQPEFRAVGHPCNPCNPCNPCVCSCRHQDTRPPLLHLPLQLLAPGYAPITFAPDDSQAHSHSPSDVATGGEKGIIGNGRDEHEAHGGSVHNNALYNTSGHLASGHLPMGSASSGASSPQQPFPGLPPQQHPPPYQHHHWRPMSPHAAVQQKVLISRLTKTYLSDVQDHLSSTLDSINSLSEQCRDLIALIFNLAAHQTNQSMQALTVVSVLFLPLTFLAGIYGMNFDNIPELHWEYGYAYFFCMCGVIGVVFLIAMYRLGLLNGNG